MRRPGRAGQARPTENTQPPHSISPRGLPTNAGPTIRALSTIGPSPPSYLSLLPCVPPPTSAHPRLRRHTHPPARPRSAAEARAALMSAGASSDGVASDICRQPSRVVLRRGGLPRHQYFISRAASLHRPIRIRLAVGGASVWRRRTELHDNNRILNTPIKPRMRHSTS